MTIQMDQLLQTERRRQASIGLLRQQMKRRSNLVSEIRNTRVSAT
jgi:hypothetical protein